MYELGVRRSQEIDVDALANKLNRDNAIALTGAGISVASGLPLGNEVVQGIPLNEFFMFHTWKERPSQAFAAYREILLDWRRATPNRAHQALADARIRVITQNIDGLHRDAGSQDVIELHGNLRELRCLRCDAVFASQLVWKAAVPSCPTCGDQLFPGFILEGDAVRHIARAVEWVAAADYLVVVGTQLAMDPVRQLREIARERGADVIWISAMAEKWVPLLLQPAR
ncbi:SIR2 family NAD-dependent protein deacylase [Alicyclobacillus fastidiosus]|uniref:protein acetyllysine N-acetyltransferase n=1 Tax=Alicyclobacillus fastidiosus TaxID=392011 RepID=A0ABV5AG48_9BACL|nr:Sir2 family NAD-dependent protein deacetylase [Alicyclobacillus fastidiosus]WEH12063.1 iron dicitrate transport regulator FecR [Alicyclobacillus fastidiosus]